ncbi:MAG: sodium/solute symporter [Gemmatimonadetes bacterium]|nr:sodium/solute symporter [Gemmatimonadota bacterium]
MEWSPLDTAAILAYFLGIAVIGLVAGRRERVAADYFLAGRALPWWLIGVSLIASNISTEHFVGMAGSGVDFGLAIASYEWMAAITLVVVARWFLPKLLALRITTMPEYLERRFDTRARSWLAVYMLLAYVFVAMATVLYSGGLALKTIFGWPLAGGIALLAAFAGGYTAYGGLKAVVWTDLVQGILLLLGGAITTLLGLRALGGWDVLMAQAGDKFHMVLPLDHPELPWFAVFFGGLWIANLFYWGCNQFITQRTLAARTINQGRYGAVFAAYIKLTIPFIVVIPGIVASVLYRGELARSDMAYPMLVERLLPAGLTGLVFAALISAIMSSLDSMLNSAATIFTVDVYGRHLRPQSSERRLIAVGRTSTVVLLLVAAAWAPFLGRFERVFSYIQEFWGLITPGVAVVFLGGLFWRRATAQAAVWVLAATLPVTIGVKLVLPDAAFLDQMWIAGLALTALLVWRSVSAPAPAVSTPPAPAADPIPVGATIGQRDLLFDILCLGVLVCTAMLYIVFF